MSGDFSDDEAFDHARRHRPRARPGAGHRRQHRLLPVDPAVVLPGGLPAARRAGLAVGRRRTGPWRPVAPGRHREAVRARPGQRAGAQRRRRGRLPRRTRCSASTTTWARRRSRTSWRCGSPTSCTSRSGTRNYVDHVQITMAEDIGIGGRAGYYDGIGAARDVIQNHLLQLLALTAMEEPVSLRRRRTCAPRRRRCCRRSGCRRTWRPATARGQYAAGLAGRAEGRRLPRGGRHLALDSATETFAAIELRRRHPPLGGRAVLPAHRQAARPAGHRDRRRLQARAAPAVRVDRHRGARPERAGDAGAARRGRHDPVRLQGARGDDGGARRDDGLRVRRTRSPSPRPRPTSG